MGSNGLTGRLGRLEVAARPRLPAADAELGAFFEKLPSDELRALADFSRRLRRGEPVADAEIEAAMAPEHWAELRALGERRGRAWPT